MARPEFSSTVVVRPLAEHTDPAKQRWAYAYTVTIVNTGDIPAQLIAREWLITDLDGHVQRVRGLGVVGHQPLLRPGESFQYTSGTRLQRPSGSMRGSYFCVAEDGERFEAIVPAFALVADGDDGAGGTPRVLH